jgi:DNA-binding MarR family transcriptional regulator
MQASLRDLQQTVPDLDVTIGQMGTLVLIACNPGITPTEICRAQGHEKPTITASLDALERKRLIVRKPSRLDRRSFSVYLTAKGTAFYNEISPRVRE